MSTSGRSRTHVVAALLALVAGATTDPLAARQSHQKTELLPTGVIVDFAAVQPDGTPLLDLRPSEVEVRINGKVRTVRTIRRVSGAALAASGDAARIPAPYGTNDSVVTGRSFAIVVDEESFTAGSAPLLRNAVEGLGAALTPADQTMIAALPFGGVKLPFTADRMRIRQTMAGIVGQGRRSESGSDLACRTRRFLESLEELLQKEAGRRSPLTVVLFSAGLAAPRRDAPMTLAPGMCELRVEDFQRVTAAAGAARANFFVVAPDDIRRTAGLRPEGVAAADYLGSDNPLEGLEHIAGVTGGVRMPLNATGTASLLRVARESSAYFEAEVESERGEVLGRSRSLDVRVNRRGVTVRARPQITVSPALQTAAVTRLAMPEVLASTEAFTDLPLRVAGFTVREPAGGLRVGVVVEAADSATVLSSVGAILIDEDARVVGRWFATDAAERPLLGAMAAPPGTYRLRVAAIDSHGRSGAAEDVIDARLTAVGPLTLGSLVLGVSIGEAVHPQLEFHSEPTAIASFDIYGGPAGMQLSATLEIARDAAGPAIIAVPLALARADETRVVARGAVPIGALPPGDYVVRGMIRLEDGTTGRVMRTLRKTTP